MSLELVAQGLQFPEGPVALSDGSVLLVEIRRKTLTRVTADGQVSIVADVGGGPNGLAIGPDCAVYIANNGGPEWRQRPDGMFVSAGLGAAYEGGSIQRVDLGSGTVTTIYTACDGRKLRWPNDLVFDSTGGFWFTDSGTKAVNGQMELGQIFYARPDGSEITRVREGMIVPNGIGLSADERTLYVAETLTSRLWAFDVIRPGVLAPPDDIYAAERRDKVLGPLSGFQMLDSLAVEADGKICVGTLVNGGITIFDPASDEIGHLPLPDRMVTNICFGGPDMRDAWITAAGTGRLYKCRWPRPGLKLRYNV
ncbi:MAG: SMP-30/gluconolactonase/LRE family protein [Gammaproteobacteria bacterium]|nr:SMP-30/gluconolactonase/LRE family protein [Gammaproteobacteria bacterium]